jgi:hypothetical protein
MPSGSSSTTQPFTKAFSSSRIQTYLLPERSFSPSTTRTSPFAPSMFSGLMNCGAKVPGDAPPRIEPFLLESLRPSPPERRSDTDWLRTCPIGTPGESGACMMLDFDLAWPGGGPGEGVSGSLSRPWNGPLRHRGPPCACELIWAQTGTVGRLLLLLSMLLVGGSRAPSCWRIRGLLHTPIQGMVGSRKSRRPRGRRIIYRERQGCRVRQGKAIRQRWAVSGVWAQVVCLHLAASGVVPQATRSVQSSMLACLPPQLYSPRLARLSAKDQTGAKQRDTQASLQATKFTRARKEKNSVLLSPTLVLSFAYTKRARLSYTWPHQVALLLPPLRLCCCR